MTIQTPLTDDQVFALFPEVMIDRDNIDHYRAMAAGQLVIRQCQDCGHWVYPHRPICPECWSWNLPFREISGRGKVFMFTLIHQARDPNEPIFEPVPVAAIELEEQQGLRYLATVVNCLPHQIALDMPVSLVWQQHNGVPSPAFEPVKE